MKFLENCSRSFLLNTFKEVVVTKVIQINSVCGQGSTGRIAQDISECARNNNIESIVLYGFRKSDYEFAQKINTEYNVHFDAFLTRFLGKRGSYNNGAAQRMIKIIEEYHPDIVHLHNIHGQYFNVYVLLEYLKKKDIPIIWTFHDCWPFTDDCFYFDYINCDGWKNGCVSCPIEKDCRHPMILHNSSRNRKKKISAFTTISHMDIVCPALWMADLVGQTEFNKYKIHVINNGIDLTSFVPSESKKSNKFIILGIVYTLYDRKGGKYFLDLAERLDERFQILLLGLNSSEYSKLPSNITPIKKTNSKKELAQIYSAADVFINPTLEDNFPTVNIEAIACGTPVITFETGGSPEIIDEKTGIVVNKGDVEGLVEAINIVYKKGKSSFSQKCINRAHSLFSRENMAQNYINLYRDVFEYKKGMGGI